MAAKINCHRYGTKLRHCHLMYYYRRRQSTGDSDEANGQACTNDLVMPEASITVNSGVDIGWGSQPSYPRHHINYLALPTACSSAKCSLLFATDGFIGFLRHPGCRRRACFVAVSYLFHTTSVRPIISTFSGLIFAKVLGWQNYGCRCSKVSF